MSSYWFDSHGLLRLIRLWKTKQSERVIAPAQQVLVPE
jgi:hypothetical protein